MIRLTQNDWRIFRRLQRKHNVSTEFLRYNLENIEKFIWFETWPRIVIRRYAIRKENRVFIVYYRLRRVLFDQANSKMLKRMKQNIKQWSKRIVAWQKNNIGIKEYVEEVLYEDKQVVENMETASSNNEDVSKQLKEQLELLKNGRRPQSLINTKLSQMDINPSFDRQVYKESHEEEQMSDSNSVDDTTKTTKEPSNNTETRKDYSGTSDVIRSEDTSVADKFDDCSVVETQGDWQINLESTPEKQITTKENMQPVKQLDTDEKTEKSHTEPNAQQTERLKTGLNFLDMLMCKVSANSASNVHATVTKAKGNLQRMCSSSSSKEGYQHYQELSLDSTDEFLGFEDCERIPGMLMTPIVPHSTKNNKNSVFVSESLNEYMRLNDLETNYSIDNDKSVIKGKIFSRNVEGLMTPKTQPPHFDMPAVPENLLKFRTVAERKQYLQRCSRNYRLAIINNEASIYRELQRRMRSQKVKSASQMLAQSSTSSMSFTRNGWKAASFINTEFNKYYYQVLDVDHGTFKVHLRGARGNNDEFYKRPYNSRVIKPPKECSEYCIDDKVWEYLKPIKTIAEKTKKLNSGSLPSVFKPCPLSHKTFQKPLDDDTAALLLAGGSMAVVRMPTVELEVFPEYGKPLHEIAKRYLQYILPHHDISREWAEFSVSTLQQPKTIKEAEQAAAKNFHSLDLRKSYTFVIPYLNDRNHILVRRVVDRSEKLDESFEQCVEESELVPKADFSFRKNLDMTDDGLLTCADIVSDMINTVAISCSENSFIKNDPDSLNTDEVLRNKDIDNSKQDGRSLYSSNTAVTSGGIVKKQKKQNSLLLELKRLNATIIDAAVKPENDKIPCSREYCQMGCICVSLKEVAPIREHCGKSKCMLECTCKSSNQSRVMRLDTDGRTLTTEDAFMLRRKATARLARMEKEFTSTVVLTENETLLINETNNDKKRRCTKAPKRYEDFTDTEDEQRKNSPKKTALTTIDKEKHLAIEIKELYEPVYVKDSILEQLKHCTVNLVPLQDMDNIAHWCMVHNLYKCFCKGRAVEGKPMIIEKEEINTTVEHDDEHRKEYDYHVSSKAKYTFDKTERNKTVVNNHNDGDNEDEDEDQLENNSDNSADEDFEEEDQDENDDDVDWIKERKRKQKVSRETRFGKENDRSKGDNECVETVQCEYTRDLPIESQRSEIQKPKRSLHEVRKRFYSPRADSCRRHIPTPRRMFLYCNRRRRLNILKYIKDNENDQTRLLLNEHVMRSVYYHQKDIENDKKKNSSANVSKDKYNIREKSSCQLFNPPQLAKSMTSTDVTKKKFLLVNEIVDLLEDEDKDVSQHASSTSEKPLLFEKLSLDKESVDSTNHFQICSNGGIISVKKFTSGPGPKSAEKDNVAPKDLSAIGHKEISEERKQEAEDELKLPKIASCFSLNVKANLQKPAAKTSNEEQSLDFTSATSVHSAAFSQNQQAKNTQNQISTETVAVKDGGGSGSSLILDMDNENVRDVYNSVIKTMNSLVSKKMQDIDCALQRESHIIPTPNADILCIMKWCNFLDAFCEGFAYIWQVKLKDDTFFAVTIQNIMPLVIGAMGIVNITALKAEKMPLLGRMLLLKFRNKETEKLAVVMQGKQMYWVVKGFLKADPTTACNKPTPESHPSLTKKINVLCSLLVKQKQKEQKKKDKLINHVNSSVQTITTPIQAPSQPQQPPKVAQIMPTRRIVTVHPCPSSQTPNSTSAIQLQQSATLPQAQPQPTVPQINPQNDTAEPKKLIQQSEMEAGKVFAKINSRKRKIENVQYSHLMKMDSYSKMGSNIEYRSVTQSDIDEIFLPELHKLDHKWLVLDLHNDFSHIFVPKFRDLVSLDRIQKVINFARQKSKIVKLQFFQNAPFDAFVTPKSIRKIYFGPLTLNMKAPVLILLQSVDGQMTLRELYQLQHNIVKKPEERTKAFWLVHLKGQTHFEMDVSALNEKRAIEKVKNNIPLTIVDKNIIDAPASPSENVNAENNAKNAMNVQNADNDKNDDDEDCMIIEEPSTNANGNETISNTLPQTNTLPTSVAVRSLIAPIANHVATPAQSLLKMPSNAIIKPLGSTSNTTGPVSKNVPPISATSKPLPILTLPPNTIITGINPPTSMTANVAPTQIVSLPKTAIITGIESAPPEAPYSSTIFITSSSSTSATTAAPTTTICASTISNTTMTSKSLDFNRTQIKEISSAVPITQSSSIIRQALEAGPIKRRRISLFCSNKYDKISENLAVDAVIRKILPDNVEDIQINPMNENRNQPLVPPEVVTTVGSTQISKVLPHTELNIPRRTLESSAHKEATATTTSTTNSKAPIVFDVNFMDDGDEPTASIVIKPTSSSSTATSSTTTTATTKPFAIGTTATNTSVTKAPVTATSVSLNTNSNNVLTTGNFIAPPNKRIKLPILFNATTTPTSIATATAVTGKTKLLNSFLCTKQQTNIVPRFSTPQPIAPKLTSNTSCSSPSPPSTDNLVTPTPFPFRRSSISVKVQKVATTTTVTSNKPVAPLTLTVKQVQDMLNKPSVNVTSVKSATSTPGANSPMPTMPLQLLPTIKATIVPAKVTLVSGTSTTITPTSSTVATSGRVGSSTLTTSALETTSQNATLTISKVQSFGTPHKPQNTDKCLATNTPPAAQILINDNDLPTSSNIQSFADPQKPDNSDKNLQTLIPSVTQIAINDVNDKVPAPNPPSHIQYGYIVSPSHVNQKFVAKRVAEEYYVKVPSVGILKLQGLGAVNNYLNRYINKILKDTQTTPAVWQFLAASKAVQMQNHQKSLLVRKTKNTSSNSGNQKPTVTSQNDSIGEPILIDD